MSNTEITVRNMMVNKEKQSDFIEELQNNEILKGCHILRILDSGNYYIYTFKIDFPEQKNELKKIQDEWI